MRIDRGFTSKVTFLSVEVMHWAQRRYRNPKQIAAHGEGLQTTKTHELLAQYNRIRSDLCKHATLNQGFGTCRNSVSSFDPVNEALIQFISFVCWNCQLQFSFKAQLTAHQKPDHVVVRPSSSFVIDTLGQAHLCDNLFLVHIFFLIFSKKSTEYSNFRCD